MDNVDNPGNETIADFSGKDDTQDGLSATWTDKFEEDSTVSSEQLKNFISDNHDPKDLEAVFEVPVIVSAVLGSARMPVHQLLKLGRGAVIELDRRVGEAIDIYVNNLLIARGEVVMVEDKLGITMTEIIKSKSKI
jgi:flagellar motor switch protein FliN/FliY